jgi:hypothetical protein
MVEINLTSILKVPIKASKQILRMICINTGGHVTKSTLKKFKPKTASLAALWKCLDNTINVSGFE